MNPQRFYFRLIRDLFLRRVGWNKLFKDSKWWDNPLAEEKLYSTTRAGTTITNNFSISELIIYGHYYLNKFTQTRCSIFEISDPDFDGIRNCFFIFSANQSFSFVNLCET